MSKAPEQSETSLRKRERPAGAKWPRVPRQQAKAPAAAQYAVYLRPVDDSAAQRQFARHGGSSRWGGLHATLCSFAPKSSSGSARHAHRGSTLAALRQMRAAAQAAAPSSAQGWRPTAALLRLQASTVSIDGDASRTLVAVCTAGRRCGLLNARKPKSLHITIGTEFRGDRDALAEALCSSRWELAIAKWSGQGKLHSSELRERLPMEWQA